MKIKGTQIAILFLFAMAMPFLFDFHNLTGNSGLIADDPTNPYSACYSIKGRYHTERNDGPVLCYAGSYITVRFEGTSLKAKFRDFDSQNPQKIGFIIDSTDIIYKTLDQNADSVFNVGQNLKDTLHELTVFRLHDPGNGSGGLQFKGLILDEGKAVYPLPHEYAMKIEFYGDSFTAGSESGDDGQNNGWFSFPNYCGRILNAEIHNNGISGLAVMDSSGWYQDHTTGLQTTFNKSDPSLNDGSYREWDFSLFKPDIVVFGFGINDNYGKPDVFENPGKWKSAYKELIMKITDIHGKDDTKIILHPANIPNKAYDYGPELVEELNLEGYDVHWFRFSFDIDKHPTKEMSEQMGNELAGFILEIK
ncbi:MAG: hypothetical protein K9G70_11640 [Prolixibacteraceae bacterium]|nr:hypothetical protein [Prolixibacteraceae bacterium]